MTFVHLQEIIALMAFVVVIRIGEGCKIASCRASDANSSAI